MVDAAVAAHPKDPRFLQLAATVYEAQGDKAGAELTLRQVIDLDRGNLNAAMWLAAQMPDKQPEAIKMLERLLERRPRAVTARFELATRLEKTGKIEEARKQYDAVVTEATRPEFSTIRARATARKLELLPGSQ